MKTKIIFLVALMILGQIGSAQAAFWGKKSKPQVVVKEEKKNEQKSKNEKKVVKKAPVVSARSEVRKEKKKAAAAAVVAAAPVQRRNSPEKKAKAAEGLEQALEEGKDLGYVDRKARGAYMTDEDRRSQLENKGEMSADDLEEVKKKGEEIQAQVRVVQSLKGALDVSPIKTTTVGVATVKQAQAGGVVQQARAGAAASAVRSAPSGGYRR